MKNTIKLIGLAALAAVLIFTMASCDTGTAPGKGSGPTTGSETKPTSTVQNLIATADDGSKIQVLNFKITSNNGSAKAINITAGSTYEVLLAGTIISAGTITVNGNVYTFTPNGGGSPFSVNTNTGVCTGDITVSAAAKQEIVANSGGFLNLSDFPNPFTLTLEQIMEDQNAGAYWNGTWRRVDADRNALADFNQRIVFSGNTYTLYTGTGSETGTFIFTTNDGGNADYANTFVFFRRNQSPTTAAYLFEGMNQGDEDNPAFLELTNNLYDPMGIARDPTGGPESPALFLKQ